MASEQLTLGLSPEPATERVFVLNCEMTDDDGTVWQWCHRGVREHELAESVERAKSSGPERITVLAVES
jgi:hypothetical protein